MTHINQRRDTAANWASANPVLQEGEVGWETNTRKAKLGDGVTAWNDLLYAVLPNGVIDSVAGKIGVVTLDKNDVGLGNVNNTADASKPISVAQQAAFDAINAALADKAPLDSPEFTGNARGVTQSTGDNDTSFATTAFVKNVLLAAGSNADKKLIIGTVMIQWGSTTVDMGGAAAVSQQVNFPTAFGSAPHVFLSIATALVNKLIPTQNTTAGFAATTHFHAGVKTGDGTTSSANPTIYWVAVGPIA